MTDLVAFLRARVDEDEAAAKRAEKRRRGPWRQLKDRVHNARSDAPSAMDRGQVAWTVWEPGDTFTVAAHIARHDPARVLREVEAKRAILRRWEEADARRSDNAEDESRAWLMDSILHDVTAVYSDHPDYDPAWSA